MPENLDEKSLLSIYTEAKDIDGKNATFTVDASRKLSQHFSLTLRRRYFQIQHTMH